MRRLVVRSDNTSRAFVYRSSSPTALNVAELVDGTNSGKFDVSEYGLPGLFVDNGQTLIVSWPDTASGTANVIADLVETRA